MRNGTEYLEALDDGRAVYVDGEPVGDVRKHPAFAEPIGVISRIYDQVAQEPDLAWEDPESGSTSRACGESPGPRMTCAPGGQPMSSGRSPATG